ncbi:MAG: hypothetical protein HRU36_04735 [Rickettsiales bacterium]|nr:hypothetical protein [Rickettsiales bacterium]
MFGIDMINVDIDIAIVIGYMFFCLVIGLLKYGKIKTIRDYTLGVKPFSTVVLLATVFATTVGAGYVIGNAGKVYELGLIYIIPLFFISIALFILAKLLIPNLQMFRENNFISLSDIMEHWYGKVGRWTTNIVAISLSLAVTAVSVIAIGYLLHYFFDISENMGIIAGLIVVTCYSVFGGVASVSFTDVFQFLIFFIALPVACIISYQQAGGIENVWFALPDTHTHISSKKIPLFISFIFYALVPMAEIPFIQRALMAKDKAQFKKSFIGVAILMIPLLLIVSLVGLITYYNNPNIESGKVLYHFIDHYLPVGIKGLMVSGVLAIIMSTQDSYLNTTSVLISHDIIKQIYPSITNKQELFIARISCVVIALISILIVFFSRSIIDIFWLVENFMMPLVSAPLILGLVGIRINKKSFIFVVISSLTAVIVTRFITGEFDTISIAFGMITSAIVLYMLHKKHKEEPLLSFPKINIKPLSDKLRRQTLSNSYSIDSLYIVGIIFFVNFTLGIAFVRWSFFNPLNISLVIISSLMLLLLLNEFWNHKFKKYLTDIWRFCLIVGLIFIPSYIFFTHEFHVLWLCNFIFSTILYIVMSDIVVGLLFILIAGSVGYLLPQIFYFEGDLISTKFASVSCFAMIIAIGMQLYNRQTVTKTTHKKMKQDFEKLITERTEELQKSLNIKKEFLNKLSHAVRTPIHNIFAFSEGAYDSWDDWSDEEKKQFFKGIIQSKECLMTYTSNILDLALLQEKKITLNIEKEVNLVEIAKNAINTASMLIIKQNKNIGIELETKTSTPAIVECDSKRIRQVIDNLLENAITYSQYGTIKLSINATQDNVRISVSDPGVGIPDNEKLDIFDPFFEGSRTKTLAKGKGVGLSVAQKIIVLHGSTIQVKDNDRKPTGSIFTFTLPYEADSDNKKGLLKAA